MQRGGAIIHQKKKEESSKDPHEDKLSSLTQPKRQSHDRTDLLRGHEFTREGRFTESSCFNTNQHGLPLNTKQN